MSGVDAWEKLVAGAHTAPDDLTRFSNEDTGCITDIYDAMSWVQWSDDEEDDVPPPLQPLRNPLRNIGRNDPCPCGSGKKYKKCCLPG